MAGKYRVAILGLGGVGAFIGGKLAAHYLNSQSVEVIFIARGANEQVINANGLTLVTSLGEQVVRPAIVSSNPSAIGPIDLLLCCTKAYSLADSLEPYANCITPSTVILPLLNGVDNSEKIRGILPGAQVLEGCIYIVSKLIAPGIVKQSGDFYSLHFGGAAAEGQLDAILSLFKDAGINATLEDDIVGKLWAKFSFISPVATYTSAHNISIGSILQDAGHREAIQALMNELLMLAAALNISLPPNAIEKNFEVMGRLPYDTTSSMQADFINGRPTELESLTGFVVMQARGKGLTLPNYELLYKQLGSVNKS